MFANSKSKAKLAQHHNISHKKISQCLTDINRYLTNPNKLLFFQYWQVSVRITMYRLILVK